MASASPTKMNQFMELYDEKVLEKLAEKQLIKRKEAEEMGLDPNEFGNLSSIMITPGEFEAYASNMMNSVKGGTNTFNFAKEMEIYDQKE
eukprot:CAMPEP_0170547422 /NCGR_PEP_ID=MMETSP0211-20121228/5821_1 /TAXON_ID=311385 /ORGANISM="Pseudokeronopsis sp., Strain OXSARD2" /LENGTH=89 /DNA_ID=CAMNT_0010852461 /DNA_START=1308 /DNA_END=1574 /DNA_ORIENTATION=+